MKEAHIGNFADLPASVPGATFVSTKGQSTADIEIRGQATTNDAPALELPVAIFMDDIYYGTLADFDGDFYDIQQIAVLKGPQGTTFGRNVVGGALQITSNKPQLGVTDGETSITAETYTGDGVPGSPGFESQGYFNAALGHDMAGRLAYSVKDVGGYMHNYVTGHNLSDQRSYSFRPSLLWQPRDDLKITSFVQFNHEDEYSSGYKAFGQGFGDRGRQRHLHQPLGQFPGRRRHQPARHLRRPGQGRLEPAVRHAHLDHQLPLS